MPSDLTLKIIKLIKSVPKGRVATYGQIAALAGYPRGARQVSWVLSGYGKKEKLPWFRIINSQGRISIPLDKGYFRQKKLLEAEGVKFGDQDTVDLKKFAWKKN